MNTPQPVRSFDIRQLKNLTDWQLEKLSDLEKAQLRESYVDYLEEVSDHYLFIRWKVCLLIKRTFTCNVTLGQYLQDFREKRPGHVLSQLSIKTFYRYMVAAAFCERYKIDDLYNCGISPTAIYEITKRKHASYVDRVYHRLKHKSHSLALVQQIIDEERARVPKLVYAIKDVCAVETEPPASETEPSAHGKRLVLVENNKALDTYSNVDLFADESVFEERQTPPEQDEPMLMPSSPARHYQPMAHETTEFVDLSIVSDADLLLELADRKAYDLSDDEILSELALLMERYGKSSLKRIPLLQKWIEIEKVEIYGRKTG
jgi:hypothetical protein